MLTWPFYQMGLNILIITIFISLGVAQWGAYNAPSAAFFLLPTRGWELLVGVFAAFYLKYKTHLKSYSLNQAFSLLGFVMIVYSIIAFDKTTPFPSSYALIPTLEGMLIIMPQKLSFINCLAGLYCRNWVELYSAYLWHQPLLAFARHRLLGEVSGLIALCLISHIMAWFSWKFVEAFFRNKKNLNKRQSFYCLNRLYNYIFF